MDPTHTCPTEVSSLTGVRADRMQLATLLIDKRLGQALGRLLQPQPPAVGLLWIMLILRRRTTVTSTECARPTPRIGITFPSRCPVSGICQIRPSRRKSFL